MDKISLRGRLITACAGGMLTFAGGAPALAQTAGDAASDTEIVVTAQRREQRIQDVPISITALSAETIDEAGLTSFHDLDQLAPNMTADQRGDARVAQYTMRGVSSSQENPGRQSSLGIFIDGVFMSRIGMGTNDLLDIERVEVLRGPQGTLFGMNTAGGLIHIITEQPNMTEFEGYAELVAGNYGALEQRARISAPIIEDQLAFSLSAYNVHRDGIVYNSTQGRDVDDKDKWGLRGRLTYDNGPFTLALIADYAEEDSECCVNIFTHLEPGAALFGVVPVAGFAPPDFPFSREAVTNARNFNQSQGGGLSAEATWRFANGTLTSVTAWRNWDVAALNDVDSLPLPIADNFLIEATHSQVSQEFRYAGEIGDRINYVAGLFYFDRTSEDNEWLAIPAIALPATDGATEITSKISDASYAAFVHATYDVTDALSVSGGLRYTREEQDVWFRQTSNNVAFANLGENFDERDEGALTWTTNIQYDWSPAMMTYFSIARGFKPGGFDLSRLSNFDNFQYEEETNINFELGLKSNWFDHRLTLNAAVFHTIYSDFQTLAFDGLNISTQNAPEFVTQGVELEVLARPIDGLTLQAAIGYTDAHYTDFTNGECPPSVALPACDLTGRRLGTPEWTANFSGEYRHGIGANWDGFARLDYAFKGSMYFSQGLDPNTFQDSYGILNGRLGVESADGLRIEAWGRNLLEEEYIEMSFLAPLISGGYAGFVGAPQTYGLRVSKRF